MKHKDGTKVIIRSNEDEPYKVGRIVGYAEMPSPDDIPVVELEGGEKLTVFGINVPYDEDLIERMDKLTPHQQWELLWTIRDNDGGKKLILMRGLPGSGKSTLAKELAGQFGQVFSTDDFFIDLDGNYFFIGNVLGKAHDWNQRRSLAALHANIPTIVIDNTNTTVRELLSYLPHIKLARELHYTVSIREPETEWRFKANELFARGTHNVPQKHIEKMLNRYVKDIKMEDILFRD